MFSCIVNLSNTILGAGMLGLPHAFGVCGWVLGYSLLIVFACLASLGLFLLSCCATKLREADPKRGKQSFYAIAMAVLPQATTLIDAAVAIKCFGVGTSYFIVVNTTLLDLCHIHYSPRFLHDAVPEPAIIFVLSTFHKSTAHVGGRSSANSFRRPRH